MSDKLSTPTVKALITMRGPKFLPVEYAHAHLRAGAPERHCGVVWRLERRAERRHPTRDQGHIVHPLRGKRAGRACQEARQTSRTVTCAILVRWCDLFSPLVLHPGNDLGHPGEDAHRVPSNYTQWLPPT